MKTNIRSALWRVALALSAIAFLASPSIAQSSRKAASGSAAFDATACYACHAPIKALHADNRHKGVGCNSCHAGLDKHLADAKARPATRMEPQACGACHQKQFETLYQMNWNKLARYEKSQATGPSPNPAWDMLMMGHGFTR